MKKFIGVSTAVIFGLVLAAGLIGEVFAASDPSQPVEETLSFEEAIQKAIENSDIIIMDLAPVANVYWGCSKQEHLIEALQRFNKLYLADENEDFAERMFHAQEAALAAMDEKCVQGSVSDEAWSVLPSLSDKDCVVAAEDPPNCFAAEEVEMLVNGKLEKVYVGYPSTGNPITDEITIELKDPSLISAPSP